MSPRPFECPNPLKGQRCPKCGGTYVCLRWQEKPQPPKPPKPAPTTGEG